MKGFEGYKINPFVLKPTTAIKTRRKCFKYPYPNKAGLFKGCLFYWFDLTLTPQPPSPTHHISKRTYIISI